MNDKLNRPTKADAEAAAGAGRPDRGRRAFFKAAVKGAAVGVPSIVTLTSGTAWAASIDCWHRQYNGYTVASTPDATGQYQALNASGQPVSASQISQFCWDSGGIIQTGKSWAQLKT